MKVIAHTHCAVRSALACCVAALALTFAHPAFAGSWSIVTSGSESLSAGSSQYPQYPELPGIYAAQASELMNTTIPVKGSSWGYTNLGYGRPGGPGSFASVSIFVSITVVWTPAKGQTTQTDPPPGLDANNNVYIKQTASCLGSTSYASSQTGLSASASDGFGDAEVKSTTNGGQLGTSLSETSSGTTTFHLPLTYSGNIADANWQGSQNASAAGGQDAGTNCSYNMSIVPATIQ